MECGRIEWPQLAGRRPYAGEPATPNHEDGQNRPWRFNDEEYPRIFPCPGQNLSGHFRPNPAKTGIHQPRKRSREGRRKEEHESARIK